MSLNIGDIANTVALNSAVQEMQKLQNLASISASNYYLRHVEQQEESLRRAMQPLRTLEAALYQSSISEAMNELQKRTSSNFLMGDAFKALQSSMSIADQLAKSAVHQQVSLAQKLQAEQMELVRKTISSSMHSMTDLMGITMAKTSGLFSSTLNKSLADFQFRIPVIDHTASTLLAEIWGKSGITRQLDSLGIDFERLYHEIEQQELFEQRPEPSLGEEHLRIRRTAEWLGQPHVSGTLALLGFLLSIYQVLLIYLPSLSPHDSEQQQQARFEKLENHLMEKFQPLFEQAIKMAAQQIPRTEFVVKERVVLVRNLPENGSSVIAEIFPNQCVTLLAEKGKWIEVEYYDWLRQEFHNGWALRKYFARVPSMVNATNLMGKAP